MLNYVGCARVAFLPGRSGWAFILFFTNSFSCFLYFYIYSILIKQLHMLNNFKRSVLTLSVAGISIASFAQTSSIKTVPNGWHLQDQKTSGLYGISLDKAYEFVKGKKSQTVVVAIID